MAKSAKLRMLMKIANFYVRFTPSFTRVGYIARGLPLRPVRRDLQGQNWLVTGATGGIGQALALQAAARGARVFAVGRNEATLASMAQSAEALRGSIVPVKCNLDSIADIADLARGWPEESALDVLANNVGILNRTFRQTAEGFEETYATNLLGHYVLTEELFRAGRIAHDAAIINMVSGGLYNAPLNIDGLDMQSETFNGFFAYASHKRAQLALADHWRETFAAKSVRTYAVHPGWADTAGVKTSLPVFRKILAPILRTAKEGADTALWLAATRPKEAADQVWFDRRARNAHAYPHTRTPQATAAQLADYLQRDFLRVRPDRPAPKQQKASA